MCVNQKVRNKCNHCFRAFATVITGAVANDAGQNNRRMGYVEFANFNYCKQDKA